MEQVMGDMGAPRGREPRVEICEERVIRIVVLEAGQDHLIRTARKAEESQGRGG